jgi:outer membrane murein-binding lipoprotein Lpp
MRIEIVPTVISRISGSQTAAVVCLALLLAGCGSDDTEDPTATTSTDRRERIDALERRVDRLRERVDAQRHEASEPARVLSRSAQRELEQLVTGLGGEAGVALGAAGTAAPIAFGSLSSGSAWSTIKIPIAYRVLADAGGPDAVDGGTLAEVERALTASDNAAAASLFARLQRTHGGLEGAAAAVADVLREAGDDTTVVSTQGRDGFSPYGQTDWSLTNQHRFMAALAGGCLSDPASTDFVLEQLSRVIQEQRWGLGASGRQAWFKGGWGPGIDGRYLVRQVGMLELDDARRLVVALAAQPGSFAAGQAALTEIAAWLNEHANEFRLPTAVKC